MGDVYITQANVCFTIQCVANNTIPSIHTVSELPGDYYYFGHLLSSLTQAPQENLASNQLILRSYMLVNAIAMLASTPPVTLPTPGPPPVIATYGLRWKYATEISVPGSGLWQTGQRI